MNGFLMAIKEIDITENLSDVVNSQFFILQSLPNCNGNRWFFDSSSIIAEFKN
jgi:hypothetical protein